ncbi:RHS repeat-associated core domain-containing protein [Marinobacterium stanieri]|uniref:RHS repeat-associated core domain-containing protein n=1 Tax=Marinobacterium stanieri TaxID=49186 RepID=A0A1N6XIG6_9GAMM|nr:RHS repeat-associated core domain-containing protein [Marinobacterium stanieri]SIR02135.1 RHS repeat-associated core domain-containing protein [Marinobacterium stanieri]
MMKHLGTRLLGGVLLLALGVNTAHANRSWTYTYHPDTAGTNGPIPGQMATADGPRTDVQDVTSYDYDGQGNLIQVTNALGQVSEITAHDADGRPLTLVDPNGVLTTLAYDGLGRLITRTTAGATTGFTYDAIGNLTGITLPDQTTLTYLYDDTGRVSAIADSLGNRIEYVLDAAGNRVEERILDANESLRYTRAQVYDELSRLLEVVGLNGSQQRQYDLNGNLVQAIDGEANTTAHAFDALNRLTQTTDALQGQTLYSYDSLNQLTSVSDPNGHTTQYVYNGYGDRVQQISPDTGTTSYTYDSAGNLTGETDANGQQTHYAYDALNRLTEIEDPYDPSQTITLTYDDPNASYGIGQLTNITGPNTNISYDYTARGLKASVTHVLGGIAQTIGYGYNDADVLSSITYPSGRVVLFQRDAVGNIESISTVQGGVTTTLANSITHAPFGPVSGLTYGNGLTLTNTYDIQYRLTDTQVGQLLDRNYSFNGNDDITGVNREVSGQLVFDYDPLRRLEYAQTPSTILSWTYDSNGNRLSETAGQSVDTYYVDSWSNRLLEISGSTQSIYTYDANGNVLSKGGLSFSYDRYNSLTSVSGTVSATYTYNANRQRTSKTVNGQTTYYLYNQSGQLLAELDHSGQTKVEYVWLGTQPLAVIHSGPASAVVYYIHTDHLNTPQVVSDNQGTVVWRADYDAFGQASVAPGSILTFNLRFPGQYFDSETGLHYNYYRDYDPSTGRYIQSDPIGLEGGLNTYAYVGGNPLSYVDPEGLRGLPNSAGRVGGGASPIFGGGAAGALPSPNGSSYDDYDFYNCSSSPYTDRSSPRTGRTYSPRVNRNGNLVFSEGGSGAHDDRVPTSEAPYPNNPDNSDFDRINGGKGAKLNPEDGSVWERDKSQHGSRQGDGSQWKRWPNKRSWEKGEKPNSIWPDGRIRK